MALERKAPLLHTRRGTWLWIAVTLFVAGWMFLLGLMIGRGSAPIPLEAFELSEELAGLKAALIRQEQAKVAVDSDRGAELAQNTDVVNIEALRKGEVNISSTLGYAPQPPPRVEPVAKMPVVQTTAAVDPQEKAGPDSGDVPDVNGPQKIFRPGKIVLNPPPAANAPTPVARPAQTVPPAAAGAPAVAAASPVAPSPQAAAIVRSSRFTIQIAAVRDAASANRIVNSLRSQNFPAYHLSSDVPGQGVWFRVRVGAFADRESAEAMRSRLSQAQFKGMVVATP